MVEKLLFLFLLISTPVYGDDDEDANYKVESISDKQFIWGHSPFCDETKGILYFVDIFGGMVNSYKPSTKELHSAKVADGDGVTVSVIIPYQGVENTFAISLNTTIQEMIWDGESERPEKVEFKSKVTENETLLTHHGKVDDMGRLWIGTRGPFSRDADNSPIPDYFGGALNLIHYDGTPEEKIPKISIPDGLAWSLDNTELFFGDAWNRQVLRYNYDSETGEISNGVVAIDTTDMFDGLPAGMAIDSKGHGWIAQFFNGTVGEYDMKTGKCLRTIQIPANQVTCVAWCKDVLYVTTSQILQDVSPPTEYSGRVYAVTGLMSDGEPVTGPPANKIVPL